MWTTAIKSLWGLTLAMIGAVGSAMLTTSYKNLRANGESYLPALSAGFRTIGHTVAALFMSPWFLIPIGAVVLVLLTARLTLRASRPKTDPCVQLGVRMNQYVRAAQHDQRFRRFSSLYHDTIRICREIEAFIVEVSQHGIPVPTPQTNQAEEWIDICCEYLMAVGPYLRSGNQSHAIWVAQGFADRYPSQIG
jgi:hypothetical protein